MTRIYAAALVLVLSMGTANAGGRPAACHGIPWCGCWLRIQKGINDVRLNLARNWASLYGRRAHGPAPGVVAVWPHHVGEVVRVTRPGKAVIRSGNDGGRVRERERSIVGVIAWRAP